MTWLLTLIEQYLRRRAYRKNKGVLLFYILYQPEHPAPNVVYSFHPDIECDDYLQPRLIEVAEHIRKYYGDWRG